MNGMFQGVWTCVSVQTSSHDFSLGAVMDGLELEDRNLRIRNTRLNTQGGHPSSFFVLWESIL